MKDALLGRWPAAEYVHIHEAPENAARQGRRLDVLVVSMWKSRGFSVDGVEVKVSMADWKRELEGYTDTRGKFHGGPGKADFWWNHVDRFWIAAPAKVAAKIKPQLPPGWGLLSVDDAGRVRAMVDAAVHEREDLPWPVMAGVLRAAQDTSSTVLARERAAGREQGRQEVMQQAGRLADGSDDAVTQLRLRELTQENERLRETIREFEEASGVQLAERRWDAGRVGQAVALVLAAMGPGQLDRRLGQVEAELGRVERTFLEQKKTLAGLREMLAKVATDEAEPQLDLGV